MLASALISRSLRLINVPGQGASLQPADQNAAFEALQLLLDSKAVSRQYVPGIIRHVFALTGGEHIYSYGPGGDFDTDDFDDPVPSKVEDARINVGGTLTNNEKADNHLFNDNTGWTLGTGWTIQSGRAQCAAGVGALSQTIDGLTSGVTYDVKINLVVVTSDVDLTVAVIDENLSGSGFYEFTFTATAASHVLTLTPTAAFTGQVANISVRPVNTEHTTFDEIGSDFPVRCFDQRTYNRQFTKGAGGRPYELLFSNSFPLAEIRFDNASSTGDFIVLDVTVNRIGIASVNDELRMYPVAMRYVRYQLASELAPEYGKTLKADAVRNLKEARADLRAANARVNNLRMDRALLPARTFDINRGDP